MTERRILPDPSVASQTRCVWALIVLGCLVRLAFAWATGLGMDESYMVAAGRVVSLGYFDHPPASWWLSWGAAWLFGSEAPVVVRLPFILLFGVSTWLMYRLGCLVRDTRAGLWAAVALNLSPVFGVTGATWVLPDGPLLCALLGAALCLVRAIGAEGLRWWAGAGVCAGLALFSKYSAVLTIGGAFLFLLASPAHRAWLRRPGPWVAGGLAVLVFLPVILWNAGHDWASFAFQGQRSSAARFRPLAPLEVLGGGALFVLPWFWVPMVWLGARALWRGSQQERLLAWLAAPPIVVFALVAAWSGHRVLFHWAAPGYLMLFPLLGAYVADRIDRAWMRRVMGATAALVLAALAVIGAQTRFDVLGPVLERFARKDPTIEGVDWASLRTELDARGLLPPGTIIGLPNWRDGGKIAYGIGPDVPATVLHADSRQFGLTRPARGFLGRDLLVVTLDPPDQAQAALAPFFERLTPLPPVPIRIGPRVLRQATVIRGERLRAPP